MGVQPPKIIAARPMNPRPAVMSRSKRPVDADGEVTRRRCRPAIPPSMTLTVARAKDVDAHGVRRRGMLAHRPDPQPPAGVEQRPTWMRMTTRRPYTKTLFANRIGPMTGMSDRSGIGESVAGVAAALSSGLGQDARWTGSRDAGREDVDHGAGDDLVDQVADGKDGQDRRRAARRRAPLRRSRSSSPGRTLADTAATNAPARSIPSMAMLTTPERSHSTPERAPNMIGHRALNRGLQDADQVHRPCRPPPRSRKREHERQRNTAPGPRPGARRSPRVSWTAPAERGDHRQPK